MPPDVFCAAYDDPQQGLVEWEMYRDRMEWATSQAAATPPVDGGA